MRAYTVARADLASTNTYNEKEAADVTNPEADIRVFLGKYIPTQALSDDDNIFERGFINSLFAAQLIVFLENHFGISIPDEELELNNFQSIVAMAKLAEKLRAQVGD